MSLVRLMLKQLVRPRCALLVAAWTMCLLSACGLTRSGEGSSEWRVGALYPLSGSLSVLGTEALAGAEVAIEMINEGGGVNGRKITLVKADVTDPTTATSEARRLVNQERVGLLIGTYGSSISLANAAVANQYKIPYIEGGAVTDDLMTKGYPYVFRLNDNADAMARALVEAVPELIAPRLKIAPGSLKLALIHEDSAFGSSIAKDATQHVQRLGLNLVATESYAAATQDLSPLVLRMARLDPDVLLATQYFNDAILFWKQARENRYNPKNFIAIGAGQATPDYQKGVGKDAEGVLMADVPAAGVKSEALLGEARSQQAEFLKRYEAKMGKAPASHATRNFSAMHTFFTRVLAKAGTLEPESFRKAALSLDEPIGSTILGFGIKLREDGQNERAFNVILQWQQGKLVTVWPDQFATAQPSMIPLPTWDQRDQG